jgi:septum site-determining protein MinC
MPVLELAQFRGNMTETVSIKGTNEGLVISLGSGSLQETLKELESALGAKASFFVGGRVALRVGNRPLSVEQLAMIGQMLESHSMTLWAVDGEHPATLSAAGELGLETALQSRERRGRPGPEKIKREELSGIVERRTLRSGQALQHAGHVTLIGDLNPGAEIVAGGDIIVFGRLRGIAHAGAMGDDEAIICALELAPSQIRIGAHIARPPDRGRPPQMPEIASVQDGGIVVERWTKTGWSLAVGSLRLQIGG